LVGEIIKILRVLIKRYGVAIALCIATLYLMNRLFKTVCFSILLLGIPCPACGITRATKLLLTGQIKKSFNMHPLLILVIIGIILTLIIKFKLKNYRFFIKPYVIICLSIFVGFYLYRMITYYPNVEPLTYREDNMLEMIIRIWSEWVGRGYTI
jgi:hypothetical protein